MFVTHRNSLECEYKVFVKQKSNEIVQRWNAIGVEKGAFVCGFANEGETVAERKKYLR